MKRSNPMEHFVEIKVRGYHLDVFGHVNNARYLEFLEEGRWSAFEAGFDLQQLAVKGYSFVVVNININYRRPAFLNEVLRVATQLKRLNHRSGVIHQAITLKGSNTPVADAEVTFVIFDNDKKSAVPLKGELKQYLERL